MNSLALPLFWLGYFAGLAAIIGIGGMWLVCIVAFASALACCVLDGEFS